MDIPTVAEGYIEASRTERKFQKRYFQTILQK